MEKKANTLKSLPSIDKLLQSDLLSQLVEEVGHESVKLEARSQLDSLRAQIIADDAAALVSLSDSGFLHQFCLSIHAAVQAQYRSSLVPVFNLSGTVVHTNLGRACLPSEAVDAMVTAATNATNLEYDLVTGKRGDRDSHLEQAICAITGAEAATVVNNNAAAVLLVLNTLAKGKEVIISRGELVEIGGAFRIPDVMSSASCVLREVGTTNRTHLKDYDGAIGENTALLMKVHTSNYEIRGFTKSVAESDLSVLAKQKGIGFVSDLGSGSLLDLRPFNLPHEPTVKETLDMGADLVTFSGDKLLGGPQAGIIVGKRELIEQLKSNPLKRALRVDKITLAALLAVIQLYNDPQRLGVRLPLLADLSREVTEIEILAQKLLAPVQAAVAGRAEVAVLVCKSQIGSGALPLDLMESRALCFTPIAVKGKTDKAVQDLASSFRRLPKPVIGRINDGSLLFDLRCLRDVDGFVQQLTQLQ